MPLSASYPELAYAKEVMSLNQLQHKVETFCYATATASFALAEPCVDTRSTANQTTPIRSLICD
ncbi:hypothetical protein [Rheinheimera nanhaiensis]|uniref:Uncharacterized protein n=1 Tax=Rheinheimera nanhaiensis E407-8 TaxID=562729 RepID=I1E008_9GAMM|nr:hypothetical protein [Rheinheimera nanhaiensis]GAB59636.1 hypothetical protein RNAN_2642 [Rheinheimera nanhaiensis E407-8]